MESEVELELMVAAEMGFVVGRVGKGGCLWYMRRSDRRRHGHRGQSV